MKEDEVVLKNKPFFISFFIILLTISIGNSATYCTETVYNSSRLIINDYNIPVFFQVSFEGNATTFTTSNPSISELSEGFILAQGESKKISFITELPFEGYYELNLVIEDSKGSSKTLTYDFSVENCHTISVDFIKEDDYCFMQEGGYSFTVENTGEYNETLNLLLNQSVKTFNLSKGEVKVFNYSFTPGNFNNKLVSLSINNSYINHFSVHELIVNNCESVDYEINEVSFCEGMRKSHEFIIMNEGVNNDTYELNSNSESVILERSEVFIPSGEEELIHFNIVSQCGDEGYEFTSFDLKSVLTGEELTIPVIYEISDCFDYNIGVSEDFTDYCEGDDKLIRVSVENTGIKPNNYTSIIKLGSENKTTHYLLEPSEEEIIELNYSNIPEESLELFFQTIDDSICPVIKSFDRIVQVKDYKECYSGSMFLQSYFYDNNTELTISNNGTRVNTYNISLLAYNEVDNSTLSLESGESETYNLNDLIKIREEYGVDSFKVELKGAGIHLASNTTYYPNQIQGMIITSAKRVSFYLGVIMLLLIVYVFIRKE